VLLAPAPARTARLVTRLAVALRGIVSLAGVLILLIVGGLSVFRTGAPSVGLDSVGAAFALAYVAVAAALTAAGYTWCYSRIERGAYDEARPAALSLGVLGLIFGGVVAGILYLVAYVELGEALQQSSRASAAFVPYDSDQPASSIRCPRCRRPAAYVPPYQRYYCFRCARYA
jgi:hypothetical protein